ncbi:protein PRRC1-like isoform X2 [Arctopsyche grandis]
MSNNQNAPKLANSTAPGGLLSRVAPPSALPSFVTTPLPQQASENLIKKESTIENIPQIPENFSQTHPFPTSVSNDFIPTSFSPVIPAIKGAPMEASQPFSGENTSSDLTTPSSIDSAHPSLQSAHEAEEYLGDPMPGSGIFTWVKGAVSTGGLLHRVAEKAKSSVDSMITTLDPQMKEYIYSGGDTEIVVASDKEDKVSAIREAFQSVFGKATVVGLPSQSTKIAAQPVGFPSALSAAKERIGYLRSTNNKIGNQVPIVAIENFVLEVTSERWFDLGVLILTDPPKNITLEIYTQMTPIPLAVIAAAKGDTPKDYPLKETGFSTTIGSYMAANLQVHHKHWHENATGVSRRELILQAAKSLAVLYKKSLSTSNN